MYRTYLPKGKRRPAFSVLAATVLAVLLPFTLHVDTSTTVTSGPVDRAPVIGSPLPVSAAVTATSGTRQLASFGAKQKAHHAVPGDLFASGSTPTCRRSVTTDRVCRWQPAVVHNIQGRAPPRSS